MVSGVRNSDLCLSPIIDRIPGPLARGLFPRRQRLATRPLAEPKCAFGDSLCAVTKQQCKSYQPVLPPILSLVSVFLPRLFRNKTERTQVQQIKFKQISESFRRFGLSEKTQHVLAVKVAKADIQTANAGAGADANADAVTAPTTSPTYDSVFAHLDAHVTGSLRPFTDANLAALRNDAALRKIYKTVDVASIMGSMAIKGS